MPIAAASAAEGIWFLVADMKQTKKIAVCALCGSLGVIFLYFGALLNVLDMSAAILASLLVLFCVMEFGYAYAFAVYALISVLSLLLHPNLSPAIMFMALFGYVPITKFGFEHLFKKFAWIPKIILYNAVFAILLCFAGELLGFTADNRFGIPPIAIWILYFVLANALFVVCDILYSRLIRIYIKKYRDKIHKYLK